MEVFSFKMIVSDSPDIHSKKLACLFVFVDIKMRKFMFICWYLLSRCCCSKYCRAEEYKMAGSKENHLFVALDGSLPNIMSNPQLLASASAQTFYFNFFQ